MGGTSAAAPAAPKRQCWECLRRRLVCDSVYPVCNQCRTKGITCPGYEDKKPLTWLAPGRVTSRTRRRRKSPAANNPLTLTPSPTPSPNPKPEPSPRHCDSLPPAAEPLPKREAEPADRDCWQLATSLTHVTLENVGGFPRMVLRTDECDAYHAAYYCESLLI